MLQITELTCSRAQVPQLERSLHATAKPNAAKNKEILKKPYVITNQETNYNRYIHRKEKVIQA